MKSGPTVLITGANGFLGYYLVAQLLQKKVTVIATGIGNCRLPFQDENFSYHSLDFTDEKAVSALFLQTNPDVVVHCGALSKPDACEQNRAVAFHTNVTGTTTMLAGAAITGAQFIFLSTDFVFRGTKDHYTEEDDRNPVNYYGQTKRLAEDDVVKYPFNWSIVRTVLGYGKSFSGRENIVTNTALSLEQGRPLKIFDDQFRTPTYIEDLAMGICLLIDKKASGCYHLSGDEILSPYAIAVATANYLGYDASLITPVKAYEFEQPARRPARTVFHLSKAKANLGYQPRSFAQGLQLTFHK